MMHNVEAVQLPPVDQIENLRPIRPVRTSAMLALIPEFMFESLAIVLHAFIRARDAVSNRMSVMTQETMLTLLGYHGARHEYRILGHCGFNELSIGLSSIDTYRRNITYIDYEEQQDETLD